jgi:hypothetical protein
MGCELSRQRHIWRVTNHMPVRSWGSSVEQFAVRSMIVTAGLLTILVALVAIDHLNKAQFLEVVWTFCGLAGAGVIVRLVNYI